jgi:hypothetical protein
MTTGEKVTGVRDEHYNLVSILYHSLQGAKTMTRTSAMRRALATKSLPNSSAKRKKKSVGGRFARRNCWDGSSPRDRCTLSANI